MSLPQDETNFGIGTLAMEAKAVALALAAVLAFGLVRGRFSHVLRSLAIWAVIVLALLLAYTYRSELRDVGERVLAQFIPGHAISRGHTVEVARGSGGSFALAMQVNGARIPMVLDTGASSVVLTQEAARAAGLPLEILNYSANV